MSILNVNQIQPVGGGNTITVSASDVSASGATITATSFVGSVTGSVTGDITGNITGASATFSGNVDIADKIIHTGDTDTAMRFPADNTFAVDTAGSERLRINSSGNIGIGTDNPQGKVDIWGNVVITDQDQGLFFSDPDNKVEYQNIYMSSSDNSLNLQSYDGSWVRRLTIDTSGNIGIHTASNIRKGWGPTGFSGYSDSQDIALAGTSSNNGFQLIRYNTGYGAYGLTIGRSKHGTVGTHGQVVSNNDIGHIQWVASDGSNFQRTAQISGNADGNITSSSAEGKLIFKTSKSSSTTPTQAMTIKANHNVELHDGNLVFETSGNGIDFSATANSSGSMSSELLDDYEEGTFTAVLNSHSDRTNTTATNTTNSFTSRYTKVGRLVTVHIHCTSLHVNAKNHVLRTITGLPFESNANNRSTAAIGEQRGLHFVYSSSNETTNNHHLYAYIQGDTTTIDLGASKGSSAYSGWPATHNSTSSQYMTITIQYITDT